MYDEKDFLEDPGASGDGQSLSVEKNVLWRNGEKITVSFYPDDKVSPDVLEKIMECAQTWTKHANISFECLPNSSSGMVRVALTNGEGHWSFIGTGCKQVTDKSKCTMNLDPGEINAENLNSISFRRIVLHEFGHVLGCFHEHQRLDAQLEWNTDNIVAYYTGPPNNWSIEKINHNIFNRYGSKDMLLSAFDPHSIMQYSFPPMFMKNGIAIIGGDTLSDKDIELIMVYYPQTSLFKTGVVVWPKSQTNILADGRSQRRVSLPFTALFQMPENPDHATSVLLGIKKFDTMDVSRLSVNCEVGQAADGELMVHFEVSSSTEDSNVRTTDGELLLTSNTVEKTDEDNVEESGFSWLALSIPNHGPACFQFDRVLITPTHPAVRTRKVRRPQGLPRSIIIPIKFPTPYPTDDIPKVAVWVHSLDVESNEGYDFDVDATIITRDGFNLKCFVALDTDCRVFQIGVTWLAYSTSRPGIYSTSIYLPSPPPSSNLDGKWSMTQEIPNDLPLSFRNNSRAFVAFSRLFVEKNNTHISVNVAKTPPKSLVWDVDIGEEGSYLEGTATYIAISSTE